MFNPPTSDQFILYDSQTSKPLRPDDIGISGQQYLDAVEQSLSERLAGKSIMVRGRKVYALGPPFSY
jgi:hypothetical protein